MRDEAAQTHPKEGQFTSLRPHEEDEELKRRVRDVFEALQQPYTPIEPRLSKGAFHDKSVALADETRGVDAIMMVVDSNKVSERLGLPCIMALISQMLHRHCISTKLCSTD